MKIGKELRALRTGQELSLREAGERCGFAGDELAHYERGETDPRQDNTRKISQALQEPIAYIRDGIAWNEAEEPDSRQDLRSAVLELLRETYGAAEERQFRDKKGEITPYVSVGTAPNEFVLYESDLSALSQSVNALIGTLVEHMKDPRPEKEIIQDILGRINRASVPVDDESAYDLTDQQWEAIRDLFPPEKASRGRAFKDNRLMLNGILYRMRTGVSWEKLPKRYGRYRTVYDRLTLWNNLGIWPKALERMLELGIVTKETMIFDGLR